MNNQGNGQPDKSRIARVSGVLLIVVGVLALAARFLFVRWGILYGASAVSQVDAIVGALVAIGVSLLALGGKGVRGNGAGGASAENKSPTQRWTDWLSGVTALIGAGALVVSLMNLIEPLNPPGLAKSACPGARDNNVPYVGITSGADGVNSHRGPARSFLANGRFPDSCSVGFSVYCLGDPIPDSSGSTSDEQWLTSRWLMVAKQSSGWRSGVARLLSKEDPQSQFISDEFVTPETRYDRLPLGDSMQCQGGLPYPGKASLRSFNSSSGKFTATAKNATNMGFAVWVPPHEGFFDGDSYIQIFTPGANAADNPGETDSLEGSKSVMWDYLHSLLSQFRVSDRGVSAKTGTVVVMAIPCLSDNVPAIASKSAIAGYRLSRSSPPVKVSDYPNKFDIARLARAACQAST